jgi:transcriptional regulator with XRE-family HTH domain
MPAHDGPHGEPGEDLEAFLRDLRALRSREGLSIAELAARTGFSQDTIAAAADGPVRPTMPVLEAYVRGCGDSLEAWEDRWRDLPPATGSTKIAQRRAVTGSTGQLEFSTTRLRPRPVPRPVIRGVAAGLAVAGLAFGGAVLLSRPTGHPTPSDAASRSPGGGNSPAPGTTPSRGRAKTPASPGPGATRTPAPRSGPRAVAGPEIAGVGCPDSPGDGVNLDDAASGPGWTAAAGGWTGNGCNGSAVWTMDPDPSQASPSALTWFFDPGAGASHCTLAVFVPTRNALGMGDYAIYNGTTSFGVVSVDQAASEGQWVRLGSYPATGTSLQIQFMPATATLTASGPGPKGRGHGKTPPARHLPRGHNAAVAASAASATCSG